MGHIRLPRLPRTKRWQEVISLLGAEGGSPASVATATLEALSDQFDAQGSDPGLVRVVHFLSTLPDAAREGRLQEALEHLQVEVAANPTVPELAAALAQALDGSLATGRTDFAEMASASAIEALTKCLSHRSDGLFPEDRNLAADLGALATEKQFGRLARDFFARFTGRCLRSYIDREIPRHVGQNRRFETIASQQEFKDSLQRHCHEAAAILETFAGSWWSKARHDQDLSESRTGNFTRYALKKMRLEMLRGDTP